MNPTQTRLDTGIAVVPLCARRDAPAVFYHQEAKVAGFWVPIADGFVGASTRSAVPRRRRSFPTIVLARLR
jgi:hypothetical protein